MPQETITYRSMNAPRRHTASAAGVFLTSVCESEKTSAHNGTIRPMPTTPTRALASMGDSKSIVVDVAAPGSFKVDQVNAASAMASAPMPS